MGSIVPGHAKAAGTHLIDEVRRHPQRARQFLDGLGRLDGRGDRSSHNIMRAPMPCGPASTNDRNQFPASIHGHLPPLETHPAAGAMGTKPTYAFFPWCSSGMSKIPPARCNPLPADTPAADLPCAAAPSPRACFENALQSQSFNRVRSAYCTVGRHSNAPSSSCAMRSHAVL